LLKSPNALITGTGEARHRFEIRLPNNETERKEGGGKYADLRSASLVSTPQRTPLVSGGDRPKDPPLASAGWRGSVAFLTSLMGLTHVAIPL